MKKQHNRKQTTPEVFSFYRGQCRIQIATRCSGGDTPNRLLGCAEPIYFPNLKAAEHEISCIGSQLSAWAIQEYDAGGVWITRRTHLEVA